MVTNFICLINVIPDLAGTIYIYYHQTLLYSLGGVALEYTVHQFYIADDIDEEQRLEKGFWNVSLFVGILNCAKRRQ